MRLRKHIISILLCVALSPSVRAQRTIGQLESNADKSMAAPADSSESKKPKIVPTEIRSWTVDEVYGNITPIHVDTLQSLFMNDNLAEGRKGHFNSLSNLGSPRVNRIFREREDMNQFIFTSPFDQFFVTTERFRHYNTKSPYMNISYNCCGSKITGDDHVKCIFTNNVGKRVNFGGIFDYMYGQGFYSNQNTSFMNASAWASYLGDKYNFHFYYQRNFMKMAESGGIIDERNITNPEALAYSYKSNDIPVYLNNTWNRQEHDVLFFNHHYNLGFYREEVVDSTKTNKIFVPVAKFFHTLKLQNMARNYRAYEEVDGYHNYTYLPGDSTQDRTKNLSVKNLVGVSLCEGFNKWAVFGLNAYIGYEYRHFTLADTITGVTYLDGTTNIRKYKENNVFVGGQIIREQGTMFHYNVNAEFVLAGEDLGSLSINGHGEMNFPFMKDTAQLAINAYVKNQNPSFYFRHYHSKHAWWDQETSKEFKQRIEGVITLPRTKTKLTASFENIKNYTYFANNGAVFGDTISNNVVVKQCKDDIQVFGATLEQNFKLGILHLDNEVTYQWSSNQRVLPLPKLSLYHNLYIDFCIAKVLHTQLGADVKYFSEYYAPDYSPVIGMFTIQNENKLTKIGNYPLVSVYANFALKRSRFYVQYYHANQSTGRYFWAPGYPMNPATLRLGISWNFYD